MKVEKMLSSYNFKHKPSQQSLIQCPECYELSFVDDWKEGWVETEECDVQAIVCPLCGEHHIPGWKVFNVYEKGIDWEN